MMLLEALSYDLAESSLDRFYYLARSVLVKSESLYDSFDQAFLLCFRDHAQDFDFKKELADWLNRSVDPSQRPKLPEGLEKLDLHELRRRFLERLQEQMEEHHGGNRWIGTGGTSPFGHSGAHPSGIRIGGPGGGRMAVKVAEERRFANYRHDRILDTRQLQVALKRLRKLERVGLPEELQMEKTIAQTCKNAGEIELVFEACRKNQTELILMMDVGGSMDVYSQLVESLFSAAHAARHFKSFHHFYFHNCVYQKTYTNIERDEWVATEDLFRKFRKSHLVMMVGDACMNPYELFVANGHLNYWETNPTSGIDWIKRIKEHFPKIVWMNPEPTDHWEAYPSIVGISKVVPMFPLTIEGLTEAIGALKGVVI
jgi:uncharacterized protein with von Willebrand factor type A (vWA) domain